jgi:hypothetical protein
VNIYYRKSYHTRGGSIATILTTTQDNPAYPIVASVKGEDGIAHCHEYTEKGFWDDATKHDDLDLVKEAR